MASVANTTTKQRPWWLTLMLGFFAVAVGLILLLGSTQRQVQTYLLLVQILGLWWLISGIMDIVGMFVDHTAWGWKLFTGIVGIIAGGYVLANPIATGLVLPQIMVLILGIWGLIQGATLLFLAFKGGGWGAAILGILGIIFGLILIGNYSVPGMGLTFVWVAAFMGVVGGGVMIFQAFRDRKA